MRKVGGIIDLRSVTPATMAKFERAEALAAVNPDLPTKEHCRRAGLSLRITGNQKITSSYKGWLRARRDRRSDKAFTSASGKHALVSPGGSSMNCQ